MNGYNPDRPVAQTFEEAVAMTCEQRRAKAYGIDQPTETPLPPDPLAYEDPVAFGIAYSEWIARFDSPNDAAAYLGQGEGETR